MLNGLAARRVRGHSGGSSAANGELSDVREAHGCETVGICEMRVVVGVDKQCVVSFACFFLSQYSYWFRHMTR
jgi:hypothetical protein